VPSDFPDAARTLARSGRVVRWFSTNYDASAHADLITGIPQGFNYAKKNDLHFYGRLGAMGMTRVDMKPPAVQEAEWEAALAGAPPLAERIPKAIADFHLNNSSRNRRYGESRQDIYCRLRDNPHVVWLSRRGSLARLLMEYGRHAFVISPHGRALDCYRTWEALLAGCIPVVKTSPIDYLYRDLPVAVVADWNEITARNVARWLERFGAGFDRGPLQRVLTMEYWGSQLK